jgi:hypothetical protein
MLYINPNSKKLVKPCLCCDAQSVPGDLFCSDCLGTINKFAGSKSEALKAHLISLSRLGFQLYTTIDLTTNHAFSALGTGQQRFFPFLEVSIVVGHKTSGATFYLN